jgi:hypothetical protein
MFRVQILWEMLSANYVAAMPTEHKYLLTPSQLNTVHWTSDVRCAVNVKHNIDIGTSSIRLRQRFEEQHWRRASFPRLRKLVAGLSPQRPGFSSRPFHMGFLVDKVAMGQVYFSRSNSAFPCLYHPTIVPRLFIHHRRYINLATGSFFK